MVQPATYLQLHCDVVLPERLELVRRGRFVYNDADYTYTSTVYQQVRLHPKQCADGCIWLLYVDGGSANEKLWCRTYFASEANGWSDCELISREYLYDLVRDGRASMSCEVWNMGD